ncbi:PspC domain-containing protein [Nakamurella sp. YIM 132087]|uniref:PspC domain-containing protein n=1 Tax=Nakamurella alba TaxID=2665158 RepID=A0A7K1FJJ8_9ACTN|nr:PspC domain-containing protein [Nakamurella alba]MTD14312.1 PspC domain-containing protein [Nakamurella alba]
MTDSWPQTGLPPQASGTDRRSRLPRRSAGDRKIAGVAGGLGRALGVDPVVLRVAFVVLTIFGGFGALLYVLGWLLLPDERDEVSAAEALIGRGRSSVPPVLAVGLAVIAAISLISIFSWGLPFWPLVIIGAIIAVKVARRRNRFGGDWDQHAERRARRFAEQSGRWEQRADQWASQIADHADRMARHAGTWGRQAEEWVDRQGWNKGGHGCGRGRNRGASVTGNRAGSTDTSRPDSPFDQPAFWDSPRPTDRVPGSGPTRPEPRDRVDFSKSAPTADAPSGPEAARREPSVDDPYGVADRTPPAWDPLGVAPFAWDLPEPSSPQPTTVVRTRPRGLGAVGRITVALAFLSGGLMTAGIFAGWWALPWAAVTGTALGVLAFGLLASALVGRGRSLIPAGVFLSLVTVALGVTGIHGTEGFGQQEWRPTSVSQLEDEYELNAGYGQLDLSALQIPAGETEEVTLVVRAGHGAVVLPAGIGGTVTCEADAGSVDCLGDRISGVDRSTTQTLTATEGNGNLDLTIEVRAGNAEVTRG